MHILLLILSILSPSHSKSPVNWSTEAHKINAQEYKLVFIATIEDGWNIYSQYMKGDDGPVKTSFTFDSKEGFVCIGKNEESGDIKKIMDELFGMEVIKIKHKAVFTQIIKVTDGSKLITGNIEYMCCNDQQCLPPKQVPFTFDLKSAN